MPLRLVEMIALDVDGDQVSAAVADDPGVMSVWRTVQSDGHTQIRILVDADRAEAVMHLLATQFESKPGFRLLLTKVDATLPQPTVSDEAQKPQDGQQRETRRTACTELVQDLSARTAVDRTFLTTTLLSTLVAAIGLMRDNVAVVIGAMVIAPLLVPNMTLALATTLGDAKLARRSLRVNATGLATALAVALAIGLIVPFDPGVREIVMRTDVALIDIVLAIASGCAGALAFTTGVSAAMVGVMVAVALLPPLVALGLLAGAGHWDMAGRAGLLLCVNVICVNLAGVATFLWQGVGPRYWWDAQRAERMVRIAAMVWISLLALLIGIIQIART